MQIQTLLFSPIGSQIAQAGDMGFVYGTYQGAADNNKKGCYARIWKHEPSGWRIVLEVLNPTPLQPKPTLTGHVETITDFHSNHLQTDRKVLVWLPPTYDKNPNERFPVLYLQDGQNVFDGSTAFIKGNEWRADETADSLIRAGAVKPFIMVAVYYGSEKRTDEYTVTLNTMKWPGPTALMMHCCSYLRNNLLIYRYEARNYRLEINNIYSSLPAIPGFIDYFSLVIKPYI